MENLNKDLNISYPNPNKNTIIDPEKKKSA